MCRDPFFNRRKNLRLPGYDYSLPNYYFVTICTKNRECVLGRIVNYKIQLSEIGKIARKCWLDITKHYLNVYLDEWIIMPNHIHGIIEIVDDNLVTPHGVEVQNFESLRNKYQKIIPRSLGCIIRGFKIGVTKLSKQKNIKFKWQRNYYEHIIRNYIVGNPYNWQKDRNNLSK